MDDRRLTLSIVAQWCSLRFSDTALPGYPSARTDLEAFLTPPRRQCPTRKASSTARPVGQYNSRGLPISFSFRGSPFLSRAALRFHFHTANPIPAAPIRQRRHVLITGSTAGKSSPSNTGGQDISSSKLSILLNGPRGRKPLRAPAAFLCSARTPDPCCRDLDRSQGLTPCRLTSYTGWGSARVPCRIVLDDTPWGNGQGNTIPQQGRRRGLSRFSVLCHSPVPLRQLGPFIVAHPSIRGLQGNQADPPEKKAFFSCPGGTTWYTLLRDAGYGARCVSARKWRIARSPERCV